MTKRTINSKVVNKKVLVPAVIAVVAAVVILTGMFVFLLAMFTHHPVLALNFFP